MLKYVDTRVCFAEIPDEITLAINISGCPCHCKGCHSAYLAEDIGFYLGLSELRKLILDNEGITCVSFMGGDSDPSYITKLATWVNNEFPHIKVAWYSGRDKIDKCINLNYFDYIKIGPYEQDKGPLNVTTTNQRMYRVVHTSMGLSKLYDITHKFWKDETKD